MGQVKKPKRDESKQDRQRARTAANKARRVEAEKRRQKRLLKRREAIIAGERTVAQTARKPRRESVVLEVRRRRSTGEWVMGYEAFTMLNPTTMSFPKEAMAQ